MSNDKEAMKLALEALNSGVQTRASRIDWIEYDSILVEQAITALQALAQQEQQEPVSMRLPKTGDKVICLEDDSLATVVSLTAGGSPDIIFSDGSRGTYLLREFAEFFCYVAPNDFYPDWDAMAVMVEEQQRMAKRIAELEAQPQRAWVGLTDEDKQIIEFQSEITEDDDGYIVSQIFRLIEDKLKEKNT